jgi:AraC-like DNA-binding protein
MPDSIALTGWSALLLVPATQALVIAAALVVRAPRSLANHTLAALLVVLAGLLTPYVIGYAGFYDVWPWLTYAPFAVPLAVGPLVYAHLAALVDAKGLAWWHWIAPACQFGKQALLFLLPLETRYAFNGAIDRPWLIPAEQLALALLLILYIHLGLKLTDRYRRWIVPRRVNISPIVRLRLPMVLAVLFLLLSAGFDLFDRFVRPLDYFDEFPAYVALALLTAWISVEGWRQADQPFPRQGIGTTHDWATLGANWMAELRASEWWRDPDLNADLLARRLGTNSNHLSRACNEGLGQSLPDMLGQIRSEAVAQAIANGDARDLLAIALDCGFGSKASFNRIFRAAMGSTPSAWRAARLKS